MLSRKAFSDFAYSFFCVLFCRYYDLEKWEAKTLQKHELKALKKARETPLSIADDEKRHDSLHRRTAASKHGKESKQCLKTLEKVLWCARTVHQ